MIPKTNKITLLLGQTPLALLTWNEAQAQNTEEAYAVWWVLASIVSVLDFGQTINATITYEVSLPNSSFLASFPNFIS